VSSDDLRVQTPGWPEATRWTRFRGSIDAMRLRCAGLRLERHRRLLLLLLALAVGTACLYDRLGRVPGVVAQHAGVVSPANVGYQVRDFSYTVADGSSKTVTLAVWYPTEAEPRSYTYQRRGIPGSVALNAGPGKGNSPLPLLVFSHGYGGCGTQSVYVTEYLAAQGYLVVAPDHDDASLCTIRGTSARGEGPPLREPLVANFAYRMADISAVIDEMLRLNQEADSEFYGRIDAGSVAVAGHSLGGWAAQLMSGAQEKFRDRRVKAALMFAPAESRLTAEDPGTPDVPAMYVVGEHEMFGRHRGVTESLLYDQSQPPKFLAVVRFADHYGFSDLACLGYGSIEACAQSSPIAGVVLKYSAAFLSAYLKGDTAAGTLLRAGDPRLTSYDYQLP
jgi:dienelactone hydrolase